MRAILTYHSIDASGSPVSIDAEAFRRQMEWLARRGPRVLPLGELARAPAADDAVALTFDDGLESVRDMAAPLLEDLGLPATVFVVTQRTGTSNRWDGRDEPGIPELPVLGWRDLEDLARAGLELGSHTRTHPRLTSLSTEQIRDEVGGAAADLERELGMRPESFCYPYGAVDERVVRVVEEFHRLAVTTELRTVGCDDHLLRLPRLDTVYFRNPARLEEWGSPGFGRYLAFRRAGRRVRAALSGVVAGRAP